jgi:hypothetical protein
MHINANAGLFGASTYEECLFDKMKGQPIHLMGLARDACRQEFPLPPQEVIIDKDKLKWDWCESGSVKQTICISKVPGNIKISRVEAIFFSNACGVMQEKPGIKSEAEKSTFSDKFTMYLPHGTYKCANVWIYGFEK